MGMDRRQRGRPTCQPDSCNKSTQSEIDQGLLRCRGECTHRRSPRAEPPANQPGYQSTAASAERKRY